MVIRLLKRREPDNERWRYWVENWDDYKSMLFWRRLEVPLLPVELVMSDEWLAEEGSTPDVQAVRDFKLDDVPHEIVEVSDAYP